MKGDPAEAIPLLEQTVQQFSQFRLRQLQGRAMTWLGEAYRLHGQLEKARDLVCQGLAIMQEVKYWYGVGWAQRALGRITQASGAFSEAETSLNEALRTFTLAQARFEVGCTHLALADLAHTHSNREALMLHLTAAHHLFRALRVPKYIERAEQLARQCGVPLALLSLPLG